MTELTLEPTRRGSTERIKRLREISDKECTPSISMERAVLLTVGRQSFRTGFTWIGLQVYYGKSNKLH